MKATHYIKKVKESEPFKEFIKEDPKAYLCSVFFVRDFSENHNETQVDFYSPTKKAMVSFKVDKKVERIPINKKAETITHKKFVPKTLNENTKMDVDELKGILLAEMHNRGMTYEIDKILVFLNIADDETVWNCTAFLKGLGLLQSHVEDESGTVLFMEKKSLFDLVRFTGGGAPANLAANSPEKLGGGINIVSEPEVMVSKTEDKPQASLVRNKKKEDKSKQ